MYNEGVFSHSKDNIGAHHCNPMVCSQPLRELLSIDAYGRNRYELSCFGDSSSWYTEHFLLIALANVCFFFRKNALRPEDAPGEANTHGLSADS
jgi:hypothetical protein